MSSSTMTIRVIRRVLAVAVGAAVVPVLGVSAPAASAPRHSVEIRHPDATEITGVVGRRLLRRS